MREINYMGDDYYYLNDADRVKMGAAMSIEREEELLKRMRNIELDVSKYLYIAKMKLRSEK